MRRNKELVFISRLLILTFLFQPHAFAAEPGSTPTPQPSVNAECENVCSTYNSEKLKDKIADACGPEPSPSSSPVPITNNGVTFKDFSECKQKIFKDSKEEADGTRVVDKSKINDEFAAKYGALGQYCDAKSLYETGSNWAMYSAIAYTAAAVPCWTACVVEKVPVINVGGPALEIACEVAGVVALGTDIAGTVLVTQEGGKATETWDQWAEAKLGYASTAIGATGVVTGAGTIATRRLTDQGVKSAEALKAEKAAKEATKTASKEAGKQAQEAAIKQGLKADKVALFKKAAEEGTEKAMTKGSEKLSNVGTKGKKLRGISCLTAALFTVTASIKWANYSLNKGHAADMCTKVSNLGSIQTGVQGKLFAPTDIKLDSVLGSTPDSSPSKATPGSPPPPSQCSPSFSSRRGSKHIPSAPSRR